MTDLESTKEKDSVIVVGEKRKSEDDFFIQNSFSQPVIGPVTGTNTDNEIHVENNSNYLKFEIPTAWRLKFLKNNSHFEIRAFFIFSKSKGHVAGTEK